MATKKRKFRLLNPATNKGFNIEATSLAWAQDKASRIKNGGAYPSSAYKQIKGA